MKRSSALASASCDARSIDQQIVAITRSQRRSRPAEARLNGISIYGCRLITEGVHKPDERLWLRIGGSDPVAATVIWCDGAAAGCRFDAPIPTSLVRSMTLNA